MGCGSVKIAVENLKYTGWGKSRLTVVSTGNIAYSCRIIYCFIFHTNSCKPTFPFSVFLRKIELLNSVLWIPGREDRSEISAGTGPEREILKRIIIIIIKERKGNRNRVLTCLCRVTERRDLKLETTDSRRAQNKRGEKTQPTDRPSKTSRLFQTIGQNECLLLEHEN